MPFAGVVTIAVFASMQLFIVSWLIWKKKMLSLVAGYDEDTFKGDKNKLARETGLVATITGLLVLMLPFADEYVGEWAGNMVGIVMAVMILGWVIFRKIRPF
ncbi:DUF3784 domain-containing protein [Shouchella lonarensis]|uniref:DUF3784 domain-containing protein n=1 Tax=Shouchella lonarensis TaxID=1464122 RepID=A0A1G6GHV5_9BACI|nr:DUF3784 domain-containing protein [Shouchella lonarensis]SDB81479.1 protein of unknown function [Shouchella lonarensis]